MNNVGCCSDSQTISYLHVHAVSYLSAILCMSCAV